MTVAVLLLLTGCGGKVTAHVLRDPPTHAPKKAEQPAVAPAPKASQLPRGGTEIFPAHRVVAFYGASGQPGLGVLGATDPNTAADQLERQAAAYAPYGRPVLPALDLITSLATDFPGHSNDYSEADDPSVVMQYLNVARAHRMLLLLDFQPGTSDFLSQIEQYRQFLELPDVGVALDPEWRMAPGQVPGQETGQVSAAEINQVAEYLANIVDKFSLPQKLLVVHQFNADMVTDRGAVGTWPELAVTFDVEPWGSPHDKEQAYQQLAPVGSWYAGFKLFDQLDSPLLTPAQVMALKPQPDMITYE
ncbi:MAG: hypothetical protein J2P38_10685 [Candidatus Dormibacteraeota bacterium]|nr:hypothetical protein [Candidatus Dormibacteraeota bacterium]